MLFYTTTMNTSECCNQDCNQGRTYPVRLGTHKPAEAVHQIAEPQPDALALAECLQKDVWQATPLRLSKVVELSAETLIAQRARIAELEKAESDLINQRDHCEEIIDRMADAVLGKDRPEWSSAYDFIDAAQEVEDRVAELQSEAANNARIIGASAETELALRARVEELERELAAIGAGGVEPLRKQAAQAAVPETREALAKRLIADVQVADTIATSACQRVAELPDRDSPADGPESMLVTGDELHMIVREAVIEAQSAPAYPAEGVPAQKVHPFGWFITKSKLSGDTEFTQDPVRENLARSFGYQTKALYTHPTQQGLDAQELLAALGDLSFACFGGIGTKAPDAATYNRTFAVLQKHRDAAQAKQGGV